MLFGPIVYNVARWMITEPIQWSSFFVGVSLAAGLFWIASHLWVRWRTALILVTITIGGVLIRKSILLDSTICDYQQAIQWNKALYQSTLFVACIMIVVPLALLIRRALRHIRARQPPT
jgi:hypothetical protein